MQMAEGSRTVKACGKGADTQNVSTLRHPEPADCQSRRAVRAGGQTGDQLKKTERKRRKT